MCVRVVPVVIVWYYNDIIMISGHICFRLSDRTKKRDFSTLTIACTLLLASNCLS